MVEGSLGTDRGSDWFRMPIAGASVGCGALGGMVGYVGSGHLAKRAYSLPRP